MEPLVVFVFLMLRGRDASGRLFADWQPAKLQLLFERVGFTVLRSDLEQDSLGRPGHDWLVLEMRLEEGETRPPMERLIAHFVHSGGMSGFHAARCSGKLDPIGKKLWQTARSKIQQTIWNMPVRHAGGGEFAVFQYDKSEKAVCMDADLWPSRDLIDTQQRPR